MLLPFLPLVSLGILTGRLTDTHTHGQDVADMTSRPAVAVATPHEIGFGKDRASKDAAAACHSGYSPVGSMA